MKPSDPVPGPPVHQVAPLDGNRLQLVATAAASHLNPHPGSTSSAVDLDAPREWPRHRQTTSTAVKNTMNIICRA